MIKAKNNINKKNESKAKNLNYVKKICLAVCCCLLFSTLLFGCSKIDTSSAATIILTVDSKLSAEEITVKTSHGTVSASGKVYTVTIPSRKNMAVSVSGSGLKTVQLNFSALDFKLSDTVNKTVDLNEELDTVLKLNFKSDNKVTLQMGSGNEDVNIASKGNKFTLTVPTRQPRDYSFTAKSDGKTDFDFTVNSSDIISGTYENVFKMVTVGKKLIEIKSQYSNGMPTYLTQNLNIIYGERKNDSYEAQNYDYFYELGADDAVLIKDMYNQNKKQYIKGEDIEPYGTVVTFNEEQEVLPLSQKLYIEQKLYLDGKLYSVSKDGKATETYNQNEWDDEDQERSYIKINDGETLHQLVEYWSAEANEAKFAKYVYTFSSQAVSDSRLKPIKIINDEKTNRYILDTDYAPGIYKSIDEYYDISVKNSDGSFKSITKEEAQSDKYNKLNGKYLTAYDGIDLTNKYYYTKNISLTATINATSSLQSYSYYCNNKNIDDYTVNGNSIITLKNTCFDENELLVLNINKKEINENNSEAITERNEFVITYDMLDWTDENTATLKTPLTLNGFLTVNYSNFYMYSFAKYTFGNETWINNIKIELQNPTEAKYMIISIDANREQYIYFSPNARFKITYSIYYAGTVKGTVVLRTKNSLTLADVRTHFIYPVDNNIEFPLELDEISREEQDLNDKPIYK